MNINRRPPRARASLLSQSAPAAAVIWDKKWRNRGNDGGGDVLSTNQPAVVEDCPLSVRLYGPGYPATPSISCFFCSTSSSAQTLALSSFGTVGRRLSCMSTTRRARAEICAARHDKGGAVSIVPAAHGCEYHFWTYELSPFMKIVFFI